MSNPDEERADATYDRVSQDVPHARSDVAGLADQIINALNALAGAGKTRAQRSHDAAQGATATLEETLEDVVERRPLATVAVAFGLGLLIGATWRR